MLNPSPVAERSQVQGEGYTERSCYVFQGGREPEREERKKRQERERERNKAFTTQGQILKWAALWFRVSP